MSHIRPYKPTDRDACIALFKSNIPKFFDPTELPLFEQFLDALERNVPGKAGNREEHYFVSEQSDRIVACGGLCLRDEGKVTCMAWGMVDNALHKQGIGRELLLFRLQKMDEFFPGIAKVLDTTQHSFGFFERMGFRVTKITPDYYAPGMHRYDMIYS